MSFGIPPILLGSAQFGAIRAMASSLGVDVSPINVREASEIEARHRDVCAISEWRPDRDRERIAVVYRDLIIALAAQHKLPAIYSNR